MARKRSNRLTRIPRTKRHDVTRGEYNALVDLLNERGRIIEDIRHTLDLQFVRIAQMQAQLDHVQAAWVKRKR